ncbi:hypothetical protein BDZ90DRAFT_280910 [Jaminaea rosea]|uniref:C2H2-type domain-containing protein n=1 Tax=Jaminaea rosea TaxID=1569628 RepID=A0A316ULV1_9BASI|nr:hypothetical protein BDZ90DRAFT_280910 [Jaminaea rosea]PWN25924.1 hypothetical protein BDZ90DRAFT_280910 [Jaminaea rosea]
MSMSSDEQNAAFLSELQRSHQQQQQQQHLQQPPPPRSSVNDAQQQQQQGGGGEENDQPPRKAQRRSSTATANQSHASASSPSTSTDAPPSGPPYLCPTCQTSYSRLEYLRRHERRHQDIRPFVCECGKSFSRSDVLSRHKRQCQFHLTGEKPSAEAVDAAAAKKARKPSAAKAKARKNNGPDDASPGASTSSSSMATPRKGASQIKTRDSPPASSMINQPGVYATASQPGAPPPLLPHSSGPGSIGLPPPPPFYNQGASAASHAPNPQNTAPNDFARQSGFMSAISQALNNFQSNSNAANYPPSPESSASLNNSRNSSPRLPYRDAIPYTQRSGGAGASRQSSLRKPTLDLYHNAAQWAESHDAGNRGSPAPGSAPGSRPGSVYGGSSSRTSQANSTAAAVSAAINAAAANNSGASTTAAPAFSYPANEFGGAGSSSSSGPSNQTLVAANDSSRNNSGSGGTSGPNAGDTSRFAALSTGPLSPFSGMGLNSMSPYLSAFSNARDTPLVASPGRGIAPGTPTSSISGNVFDYTMRPPAKPASSTTPGKSGSGSGASAAGGTSEKPSSIGIPASAAAGLKRKDLSEKDDPETPSASVSMSTSESGALPALADFIDDQQRTAANGLLTLLGGGGQETPSRFVRSEAGGNNDSSNRNRAGAGGNNAMDNNPGTTSANPSSNPFFESAVTSGPEAFLLRLQGGEQDRRAGLLGSTNGNGSSSSSNANGNPSVTSIANGSGSNGTHIASSLPPSANLFDTPGLAPWDFGGVTSSHGQSSSVGWLLSPSVQTLISSFAGGTPHGPGEGGSYFPMSRRTSGLNEVFKDKEGSAALAMETPGSQSLERTSSKESVAQPETGVTTPSSTNAAAAVAPAPTLAATNGNSQSALTTNGTSEASRIGNLALERALEDANNPFYLPKSMFRPCYNIPHWDLPPLTRLSVLAMHAQQNLLKHVPILHEPTFRLDTTPGCLAFAACMLGCHEAGRRWWAGEEVVPPPHTFKTGDSQIKKEDVSDESKATLEQSTSTTSSKPLIDESDGLDLVKPIVMTEKVDMLTRSFTSGRAQSEKDRISVIQALMVHQTHSFLSADSTTRGIACMAHGSLVSAARKAGFFDIEAKHATQEVSYTAADVAKGVAEEKNDLCFGFSYLPSYLPGCPDEEKVWRQWCDFEGRRRTAWLLFLMDTVAALDAGLDTLVELEEVRHLPLPVPDTIWRASDAAAWKGVLDAYHGLSFDEATQAIFADDKAASKANGSQGNHMEVDDEGANAPAESDAKARSIIGGAYGPFARLMMILPILRGIVHLLHRRAAKAGADAKDSSSSDAKVSPISSWLPSTHSSKDDVAVFERALRRWRSAWDADNLCLHASSPVAQAKAEAEARAKEQAAKLAAAKEAEKEGEKENGERAVPAANKDVAASPPVFTSKTASGATPLCEDALPFYWLSHVLLGHASGRKVSAPGMPASKGEEKDGKQTGDKASIPDLRSMLRFAKTFVNAGEGASESAGADGSNGVGANKLPAASSSVMTGTDDQKDSIS